LGLRVGLYRSSQVCSALRGLRPLGLALCATAAHPSADALAAGQRRPSALGYTL